MHHSEEDLRGCQDRWSTAGAKPWVSGRLEAASVARVAGSPGPHPKSHTRSGPRAPRLFGSSIESAQRVRLRALLNPAPVAAVPRPPRRHRRAPATWSPGERPREPGLEPDSKHRPFPPPPPTPEIYLPYLNLHTFTAGKGHSQEAPWRLISLRSQKPGRFYSACGRTESSLRGSWLLPRGDGCRTAPYQNRLGSLAARPRHLGPPQTRGV